MRRTKKPVHRCYRCPLNQGDHCWGYRFPCRQWGGSGRCPAFENQDIYLRFAQWQKQAHVKTRGELRREAFGRKRPEPEHHLEHVMVER